MPRIVPVYLIFNGETGIVRFISAFQASSLGADPGQARASRCEEIEFACDPVDFVLSEVGSFPAAGDEERGTKNGFHGRLCLVAVQFRLSPQEAQDTTAGEDPLEVSVGDHRELVDVLAGHQLKRLDGRRSRGHGVHLSKRAALRLVRWFAASCHDPLYLMGVISPDTRSSCTTTKQRRPVRNTYSSKQSCRLRWALHGGVVAVHNVGDMSIPESRRQFYLGVAGSRPVSRNQPIKASHSPPKFALTKNRYRPERMNRKATV
jgi:hypothetical protein